MGYHLAKFSYTLYLTHMIILKLMSHYGLPKSLTVTTSTFLMYIGEVVIALISAYIIYWMFERNTKKFKKLLLAYT